MSRFLTQELRDRIAPDDLKDVLEELQKSGLIVDFILEEQYTYIKSGKLAEVLALIGEETEITVPPIIKRKK